MIDFNALNDELKAHLGTGSATVLTDELKAHLGTGSATVLTDVDKAMGEVQKIRDGIKVDIIAFIREINRATMKAKDLEPNSDAFNAEIDRIHRGLTGVHIFSGSLLPYDAMLDFMKSMKAKGL